MASIGSRMSIGGIDDAVGAAAVGADREQVFVFGIGGEQPANDLRGGAMLFGGDVAHQSADALQHVDRGEVAAGGELAREPDVAIEQAAHGVGDRFVFIVALDEHGVISGDAADLRQSGPFDELRHEAEHGRRIAARGRRFAGGEADFALRHGEARDRIDQQQDLAALVAEIFGDGGGGERSLDARAGPARRWWRRRRRCGRAPSAPRSRSMNSLTSRPRSPIRAITMTSADV